MYFNGWGNICDDYYYSSTEANVICHQLGYTGASSYFRAGLVRCVSSNECLHCQTNWADSCWPTKMCQCKRSITDNTKAHVYTLYQQ